MVFRMLPNVGRHLQLVWRNITMEPLIFLIFLSIGVITGGGLDIRFMQYKSCLVKVGAEEELCRNLNDPDNYELLQKATERYLIYQQNMQLMRIMPEFFYALFIGGVADSFGVKKLLLMSITGQLLTAGMEMTNSIFVTELPMEFFYVQLIGSYLGGFTVYYLCVYTFAALITTPSTRAMRMAIFDAMWYMGFLVGTVISPVAFVYLDYTGMYLLKMCLLILSVMYLVIFVQEPERPHVESDKDEDQVKRSIFGKLWHVVKLYILLQAKAVILTVFKKRPGHLRKLIIFQLVIYSLYFFNFTHYLFYIPFLQLALPNFDEFQSSYYMIYSNILSITGLLVILPTLTVRFRMNKILLTILSLTLSGVCRLFLTFSTTYWQMYLSLVLGLLEPCIYSLTRATQSQLVEEGEFGRINSATSLLDPAIGLVSTPVFTNLFQSTIYTFPSAFLLLSSALLTLAALLNFVIYYNRDLVPDKPLEAEAIRRKREEMEKNLDNYNKMGWDIQDLDITKF